jgi:hypothetical protein
MALRTNMTPAQRQAYDAYLKVGTIRGAARELGQAYSSVQRKVTAAKRYLEQDPAIRSVMDDIGTHMIPSTVWLKSKDHSIMLRPEVGEKSIEDTITALKSGLEDIRATPRSVPVAGTQNLAAIFPVADLHIGMLADEEESGQNWDTKIAQSVFQNVFDRLVEVTPSAECAVVAQLGDLTHIDDQRNVTPQSKHQLDADTRYFRVLRIAVSLMKWAIERLREKYSKVIYRGCRGNHDMTAHYAVTLALSEYYSDCDDVEIVSEASEFYVFEHGVNMLLLHHGDRAKPDRLVQFAAAEWPEIWGRTRHRLALSGHVHHETRKELGGMAFESVGTIIPRDAYAASSAYSAKSQLISIVLDAEEGEISRNKVNIQ